MRSTQPSALKPASARRVRVLHYLIIPLLYLALWLVFLKDYQHIFKDAEISYISIAEKYARGDFIHAVNSFWPPLLSWLLAPLLWLGLPYNYAAKLLSLLIGIFVFLSVRALSYAFDLSERFRTLLLLLSVPILVYCSLIFFTPDFLLAGILSFYFSIILSRDYASRWYAGWLSGGLGALAYFSKSYAFYFFVAHFLIANLVHYWSSDRRAVMKHCAAGLAVFFGLSAIWVLLLHQKYHEVTLGIIGKYNYAVIGPNSPGRWPTHYLGFLPPPDATATSIWEDPYYFPPIKSWSPLESRRAFRHQLKLFRENVKITIEAYQGFSTFSFAIIVASLALCLAPLRLLRERIPILLSLVTLGLYPAGYCPVHTEARYLWPMLFLLIFLGGYLLELLFRTPAFETPGRKPLLVLAFAASFLLTPVNELGWRPERQSASSINALSRLLEGDNLEGSRIASNRDYGAAYSIAHHLRAKYYGQAKEGAPEAQIVQELQESGIEHYFVFEATHLERTALEKNPALEKTKEVRAGKRILSIYTVHKREESI